MTTDPTWLQSLQQATTYRQLQEAFDQMSLAIASRSVQHDAAGLIDEAIRRIEQERIRDQAELAEFNAEYDAFKGENAGVVGWFKRKLPFTATRKQDVELRDQVSDQQAEILADNFVIARAQMLKESLLPAEAARMGKPSMVYRDRLAANDSVAKLRDFGQTLIEASRESQTAEQFLTQLRADVDAFAAARFIEKDDQQLQKSGIQQARAELSQLDNALSDKKKMVSAGEDRLKQLVEQELASNSPEFQSLQDRLAQLTRFIEQCEISQPLLDARTKLLEQIKQKKTALDALPAKAKLLESKGDKLRVDTQTAQTALQRMDAEYQPVHQRYEATRMAAEQAKMNVEATRPLVNAYLAEQGLEPDSADSAVSSSPICAEYASLKAAAAAGEAQLQQATSAYEAAKRKRQEAQVECDRLSKADGDLKQELNKLNQERSSIESEIAGLCNHYRQGRQAFQTALQAWWNQRTAVDWHPTLRNVETFPHELMEDITGHSLTPSAHTYHNPTPLQRITEASSRFNTQFSQASKNAKAAQQQLTKDRLTALQQRSRLLLDSELAARLFS